VCQTRLPAAQSIKRIREKSNFSRAFLELNLPEDSNKCHTAATSGFLSLVDVYFVQISGDFQRTDVSLPAAWFGYLRREPSRGMDITYIPMHKGFMDLASAFFH
jgi:hypothetical protein